MSESAVIRSDLPLGEYPRNLACMINTNADRFADRPVFLERRQGEYEPLSWHQFRRDISALQSALRARGLEAGDRVAIVSRNRREMLEIELAVMCSGARAVPIFPSYTPAQTQAMVAFCEPAFIVAAEELHAGKIGDPTRFKCLIHFDPVSRPAPNAVRFRELVEQGSDGRVHGEDLDSDTICLMMFTSGTMGRPKCVQLTHRNILSQQAAGRLLWPLSSTDRFLSYLPWHHSYGGIFEKYSALTNGAAMALEHGYGKNLDILLDNWRDIRPTVFFSVPLIYQSIVTRARRDRSVEKTVFNGDLRFIFTAAAPLSKSLSDEFEHRGIAVIEGWGLTETSPCCTVTNPSQPRRPGVVGWPIPGVELRLAEDGEIWVRGPNVMKGYYANQEATDEALSADGWFRTGDVGEITDLGLRLISRKDRIFKLSNAEKVVPTEIEALISRECPYVAWAFVTGSGRNHPVALLFPNREMFGKLPEDTRLATHCHCPRDAEELSQCLGNCLAMVNRGIDEEFCRMESVMLIDHTLSIEAEELTPSMKLAPNAIGTAYKAHIERLYGGNADDAEGFKDPVYIIRLNTSCRA